MQPESHENYKMSNLKKCGFVMSYCTLSKVGLLLFLDMHLLSLHTRMANMKVQGYNFNKLFSLYIACTCAELFSPHKFSRLKGRLLLKWKTMGKKLVKGAFFL